MQLGLTSEANHVVAIVLPNKLAEGMLDDATPQSKHQAQGKLFLNVVVGENAAILKLFACKNQILLVKLDAFLVLDFSFDGLSGVTGLKLKGDGLANQELHEDLHLCVCWGVCCHTSLRRKRICLVLIVIVLTLWISLRN